MHNRHWKEMADALRQRNLGLLDLGGSPQYEADAPLPEPDEIALLLAASRVQIGKDTPADQALLKSAEADDHD